jgi:hypothetical protein
MGSGEWGKVSHSPFPIPRFLFFCLAFFCLVAETMIKARIKNLKRATIFALRSVYFPFGGASSAKGSTSGITLTPVVNLNGANSIPLGKVISTI